MSMIGEREPEWCGTAFRNGEEVNISSDQYNGKWHVIYWYPLDFTFVCPTEIRGFQSLVDQFSAAGVEVVGASTDSFFSHMAGRSPSEVLRTVQALQSGGLCAMDWSPGDAFVG